MRLWKTDHTWENMFPRRFKRQFIIPVGLLLGIFPKEPESCPAGFGGFMGKIRGRFKGRFNML